MTTKQRLLFLTFPILAIVAAIFAVGCDEDLPTAPRTNEGPLNAKISAFFISDPDKGICNLDLVDTSTGGELPRFRQWTLPWSRQATRLVGYPSEEVVTVSLPPDFGSSGAAFSILLDVEDSSNPFDSDRTALDIPLDCTSKSEISYTSV
ncbi:MAG: hypothetical protein AAGN66_07000 [Acidobacteriota bacterium]